MNLTLVSVVHILREEFLRHLGKINLSKCSKNEPRHDMFAVPGPRTVNLIQFIRL